MSNPSDLVAVRGAVWRVLSIEPGDGCRALRLVRLHPSPAGQQRTLIEPFDHLRPVETTRHTRVVMWRRALRILNRLLVADRAWKEPASAAETSGIKLLAWQLVPSLILFGGRRRRLLLADAVGLGKTVQAGVLIRETLDRWPGGRVLVMVPAGLRHQWRDELSARLNLDAVIVDLAWIEAQARQLPAGINPWAGPQLVITSFDFAKRAEVLPGPERLAWDLVVIDEAHALAAHSARGDLARAVCARAQRVVLLTATPHDGTDGHFASLCDLGSVAGEPPLAIVRRERADVMSAGGSRRWREVHVHVSDEEAHAQRLLERYLDRLSGANDLDEPVGQLLRSVLRKRAASSAHALASTLVRRRALLESREARCIQAPLTFDTEDAREDGDVSDVVLGSPGLDNRAAECAWLGAIAEASRRAAGREGKLRFLLRWLHRVSEPVLVFTEYRDTLAHLARHVGRLEPVDLLHGGLSPEERRRSIDSFTSGRTRLLLATDAASEGLNLHHRCRVVIMYDLPWLPGRIEQRIGRIDRMGQVRQVHGLALLSLCDLASPLASRLSERRDRIVQALTSAGSTSREEWEIETSAIVARLVLRRTVLSHLRRHRPSSAPGSRPPSDLAIAVGRPSRRSTWSGALLVFDAQLVSALDIIDRAVVGLHVPIPVPRLPSRAAVRRFVEDRIMPMQQVLNARVGEHLAERWRASTIDWEHFQSMTRLSVEAARQDAARENEQVAAQPSLFGRYAETRGASRRRDVLVDAGTFTNREPRQRIEIGLLLLRPGPGTSCDV